MRSAAAAQAGLCAGLGLPMLEREGAKSAVLLLTSAASPLAQVIEVWEPQKRGLSLSAGYYGEHHALERASRGLSLRSAQGLPGAVYAERSPILRDLSRKRTPQGPRDQRVADAGLGTALGIPIFTKGQVSSVVVLMS